MPGAAERVAGNRLRCRVSGWELTGPGWTSSSRVCAAQRAWPCLRPAPLSAVGPPGDLFMAVDADAIVPGARPGVPSARAARSLRPGAGSYRARRDGPFTAAGAHVLDQRGIVALP